MAAPEPPRRRPRVPHSLDWFMTAAAVSPPESSTVAGRITFITRHRPDANRSAAASDCGPSPVICNIRCLASSSVSETSPPGARKVRNPPSLCSSLTCSCVTGSREPMPINTGPLGRNSSARPPPRSEAKAIAKPREQTARTPLELRCSFANCSIPSASATSGTCASMSLPPNFSAIRIGVSTPAPTTWPPVTKRPMSGAAGATSSRAQPSSCAKRETLRPHIALEARVHLLQHQPGFESDGKFRRARRKRRCLMRRQMSGIGRYRKHITAGLRHRQGRVQGRADSHLHAVAGKGRGRVERPRQVIRNDEDLHSTLPWRFSLEIPVDWPGMVTAFLRPVKRHGNAI